MSGAANTAGETAAVDGGAPLLALSGIVKRFPGCLANDHVDVAIRAGRIHALLGENGAGKSTLVRIIYGVLRPDAGALAWRGVPVTIASPAQARRLGIGMVFQHFSLFEALSVAENIALGLNDRNDRRDLRERMADLGRRYGLPLEPDRPVHDLSVGERQRVEIVRCLLQEPELLIMDEPTSVLTPQEVERLFDTLRRLAREGCAILYISHKLAEIGALCDEATILRQGRVVAACDPRHESPQRLAELMIGSALASPSASARPTDGRAPLLVVDHLSLAAEGAFGTALHDVSFAVAAGEILGIGGIAGNGQTELMAALSGEALADRADAIRIDATPVGRVGVRARRRRGGCFVPEERHGHGAVAAMTLADNGFLSAHLRRPLSRWGLIDRARTERFAAAVIDRFDVRASGPRAEARALSGGNLQKFVVGREMLQQPRVLVVSQPTWGVDAGSAAAIRQALLDLAAAGAAVVVISQDLDELLALADRIAIIAGGRLSPPRPADQVTMAEIGLLMGGVGHATA
jgi:simple sugar transport system ATP-binding protein